MARKVDLENARKTLIARAAIRQEIASTFILDSLNYLNKL